MWKEGFCYNVDRKINSRVIVFSTKLLVHNQKDKSNELKNIYARNTGLDSS